VTSYNDVPSLAKRIKELERRMAETESAPRAGFTAISDGGGINLYDPITGALVGRYGQQFDGTYTASSLGGPTPPTPAAPDVYDMPGGVDVAWSGVFEAGARRASVALDGRFDDRSWMDLDKARGQGPPDPGCASDDQLLAAVNFPIHTAR